MKRKTDKQTASVAYPMEDIPLPTTRPDPVEYNGKIIEPTPPTIVTDN